MIRGIGVDSVAVSEMTRIVESGRAARMFTASELASADSAASPAEHLAACFAAKEAVFKAVAPLLEEGSFDLRRVETLNRGDGSPDVNVSGPLSAILERADVARLFLSITTEGDLATVFVIAEG